MTAGPIARAAIDQLYVDALPDVLVYLEIFAEMGPTAQEFAAIQVALEDSQLVLLFVRSDGSVRPMMFDEFAASLESFKNEPGVADLLHRVRSTPRDKLAVVLHAESTLSMFVADPQNPPDVMIELSGVNSGEHFVC